MVIARHVPQKQKKQARQRLAVILTSIRQGLAERSEAMPLM